MVGGVLVHTRDSTGRRSLPPQVRRVAPPSSSSSSLFGSCHEKLSAALAPAISQFVFEVVGSADTAVLRTSELVVFLLDF